MRQRTFAVRVGRAAMAAAVLGSVSLGSSAWGQAVAEEVPVDAIDRIGADQLPPRDVREPMQPEATPTAAPSVTVDQDLEPDAATAPAPDAPGPELGPVFPVSEVRLIYARPMDGLPSPSVIAARTRVRLAKLPTGLAAPRQDAPTVEMPVSQLGIDQTAELHVSAIRTISEAVVRTFNDLGYGGVFVFPDPQQFDGQLRDQRDSPVLTMVMSLERVTSAKTTATGPRFEGRDDLTNLPQHERILGNSPVKPDPDNPTSLLRVDELDEYALWLNRHPGRRVDVAITADQTGDVPGAELEYLVYEAKPWRVYGQTSNTGTESTADWRTQLGFIHYQLTGRDDILSMDYVTAGFDASHSVIVSYEAPLPELPRVRWQVRGAWSDYVASELGLFQEDFSGTTWTAGGQLSWNFFQDGPMFADVFGGVQWQNLEVDNELADAEAEVNLWEMDLGVRAERIGETSGLTATTSLNWTLDVDEADGQLATLGRTDPDDEWVTLQWGLSGYWYLEPLLARRQWEDPATRWATLAHEVFASFRGQYAFGNRLIPQKQQTAGGFYTVRGYDEAMAVGDTTLIGTLEYRFHLPRAFRPEPDPDTTPLFGRPFRFSPDQPYGRADWDLIFRAFLDAGRTINADPFFFEEDQTLVGTGVGLELLVLQNFSARVDWGIALRDVESGDQTTEAGDSRVHLVFTLLY